METLETTVIDLLQQAGKSGLTQKMIAKSLNIHSGERMKCLKDTIKELVEKGKIIRDGGGRFSLPGEDTAVGEISFTRKGHAAFVEREDGEDVFVAVEDSGYAIDRDLVMVKIIGKHRGLQKGKVVKVLKRNRELLVGTFKLRGLFAFVVPDDLKLKYDFYIPPENLMNAKPDEKVVVRITRYPSPGRNPEGTVEKVLGDASSPAVDLPTVIFRHNLPQLGEFPADVLKEARVFGDKISDRDMQGRKDFRDERIFTIDGDDAKDFDDAIGIKKNDKGDYILGVHIADVSHYVTEGSALDREAYSRATSVYLLDTVIPMLPVELSNGICSLNEGVDRLSLSLEMVISPQGKLKDYKIHQGVIRSVRRLTYREVNALKNATADEDISRKLEIVQTDLDLAFELAQILRDHRKKRGSVMDISSREAHIVFDDKGFVTDIVPLERGEAEEMIEEFMIRANETVAEHFFRQEFPSVYRIHEEPDSESILQLKQYIEALGMKVKIPQNIHPKALQQVLESTRDHPLHESIQKLLVRGMKRAVYSDVNIGHFGLASRAYTHFTSPIRRYPDLTVHRLLKMITRKGAHKTHDVSKLAETLPQMAKHCSRMERNANEAEWDIMDIKKAEYIQQRIGQVFETVVTGVTKFGLFVEVSDKMISGLLHVSTLDDYYDFDEQKSILVGRQKKRVFRIGDVLKVKAIRADKTTAEIDFEIVNDRPDRKRKNRR
ncbi:MAG TPA: ribonuclease R [Kosmotogaceae bacterium]|nr:MAG: Ribonuclease R [Thermotogales bacterium 46_20]HAA86138.1 ribonuclease R [Kosmotogaceae bacterium]